MPDKKNIVINQVADKFADIALSHAGKSDEGYVFNREDIYDRG